MCWSGMSGRLRLAELGEGHVGAVAEEQELEVVLPHQVGEPEGPAVGVEDGAVARLLVPERDRVGLVARASCGTSSASSSAISASIFVRHSAYSSSQFAK